MPPYDDITQTGPQTYKDLQRQNDKYVSPFGRNDLSSSEKLKLFRHYDTNRLPVEGVSYEDLGDFGNSKFDHNVPEWALNDMNEWRASHQSAADQIANGVLKGIITTGTTYIDLLAGIPVGIATALGEGRLSGIWDNAVTNAMQSVTDWSEETFPNYYSKEQQESAWYDPVNLFSANFLGDKLIKNFGFSAGAGLGMKTISRIPKMLPKLAKSADAARAINTAETTFAGAVGEGSIEALNGTKEWADQQRGILENNKAQAIANVNSKYSVIVNDVMNTYGNEPSVANQILAELDGDYQREISNINNQYNIGLTKLQDQIDNTGNLILAGNIPILWGSNILTLGKMIGRGYNATEHSLGKYVRQTIKDGQQILESTLTNPRQVLRYVKQPILEGFEEMNQAVISTGAKDIATDYYNMSIDPNKTDETTGYLGYMWDAFKNVYGDINNYEEFVIGMLSSGISDIVIGQGKALREEKQQVNDAVARANASINNFNNTSLLRYINRQQVLEDQKINAAIRNDKKEFKDAEFAQIASAVIAFSEIGKIDNLKAIIDYNLDNNLSDEELAKLSESLSQTTEEGTEVNDFRLMPDNKKREYLQKQKDTYHKVIDKYNQVRDDLIEQTGNIFTPEQQSELIYYKLMIDNDSDRVKSIPQDIERLLTSDQIPITSDITNKLHIETDGTITGQDIWSAIKEFKGSNKQLAKIFEGTQLEQKFNDLDELQKDITRYNEKYVEFLKNPRKLEQKNSKIKNKVLGIIEKKKINKIIPQFQGKNDYKSFSETLNNVDPKLQGKVLEELIKQNNREAKQFEEKTTFGRYVTKFLSESDADPMIVQRAAELIAESLNSNSKDVTADLGNPIYSRKNNEDLSDSEYNELQSLLGQALNKSSKESEPPITKKSPEKKPEVTTKPNDDSIESILAQSEALTTEVDEELDGDTPTNVITEDVIDNNTKGTTVDTNERILSSPTINDNMHDKTKEIDSTNVKTVTNAQSQQKPDSIAMAQQEVDTKAKDPKNQNQRNQNYGKPVINQVDSDGKPTRVAIEATPLYNRLKELHAFENVDNGTVKVGSIIHFALDKSLLGEHDVNGETVVYDEIPVLLYVGDKCVGNLTNATANRLGIREKLLEEFGDRSDNDPMVSKKYYTTCTEVWAGIIPGFNREYHDLKINELDAIKERMSSPTINANDIVPIITVYNANNNTFERSPQSEKFYLGRQVSNIFEDTFFTGQTVLLVPTAAYNSQASTQPEKSFMPVGLQRKRARELSPDSRVRNELRTQIRRIFEANQTSKGLDNIIGEIKKLIVYNYHTSPTDTQSVYIDPCTARRDDNGNIIVDPNGHVQVIPTVNHSYFNTHKDITPDQSRFTYIRFRFQKSDGNVMEFSGPTHNGNVKETSALPKEQIDEFVDRLEKLFLEELNSYVNIEKNRLVDGKYVESLINDGAITTNVNDLRVIGNSFLMDPVVHEQSDTQETPEVKSTEETTKTEEPTSTFKPLTVIDDDDRLRTESLRTTSETIDANKEVDRIMKMLPQLDRDKTFKIVETLIDVNEFGDKAMGMFTRGMIILSNMAEPGTGYHEAFHLVFNMILNENEKNALFDEYKAKYPNGNNISLEERMAEDFREYCMTKEKPSFGKRIANFFKRLYDLIFGYKDNKLTFDTVASNIWRGRYSNRSLSNTNESRNMLAQPFDMTIYDVHGEAFVNLNNQSYNVEDLSPERFQRLIDSQVNNMNYNIKTKTVDMNNRYGLLADRWKSLGVNIKAHKYKGKYIVDDVTLDYNNPVIRNIEQHKKNRIKSLTDDKIDQCNY